MSKNGPTFLKVYVIPVFLLSLAVCGWSVIASYVVQQVMIYLGYVMIIAVSLRLYLAYLDSYD